MYKTKILLTVILLSFASLLFAQVNINSPYSRYGVGDIFSGSFSQTRAMGGTSIAVSSPNNIVLVKPVSEDASVEELARLLGEDYDIILAEGFKQGSAPKIEVHRKEVGVPLRDIKKLIAIVTDEPLETKVRQFSFEDSKGLADLLERGFIKPQKERISLYVNNIPVPLTTFPKQIIKNVLVAMVSCLKGVKEVTSLQIFLRKEDARK